MGFLASGAFRYKLKTKHFCSHSGSHAIKKFKSADYCCRGLKLAVDEIKQLELNELNTISKLLVYFHYVTDSMEDQAKTLSYR